MSKTQKSSLPPPSLFPPPAISQYPVVASKERKNILASLPRQLIVALENLQCVSCKVAFKQDCPAYMCTCEHLFCKNCSIQQVKKGSKIPFKCPPCNKTFTKENTKEPGFFVNLKGHNDLYELLQGGKGYRCEECKELHPRLNVVRCMGDNCTNNKKGMEETEENKKRNMKGMPGRWASDNNKLSDDLPVFATSESRMMPMDGEVGRSGPSTSKDDPSTSKDDPTTSKDVPHTLNHLPSLPYDQRSKRNKTGLTHDPSVAPIAKPGDVERFGVAASSKRPPPCSSSKKGPVRVVQVQSSLKRKNSSYGMQEPDVSASIDKQQLPLFTRANSIRRPAGKKSQYRQSCVWCAVKVHLGCTIMEVPERAEASERCYDGEMIRSFDGSQINAWSLVTCAFCLRIVKKNTEEKKTGLSYYLYSSGMISSAKMITDCYHMNCFGVCETTDRRRCLFCDIEPVRRDFCNIPHLNSLLVTVDETAECSKCKNSIYPGLIHPSDNMAKNHGAKLSLCVWCALDLVKEAESFVKKK